ncbi:MAG: hypothetical protein ACO2PN_21765 [Pyrobaculum sp.]
MKGEVNSVVVAAALAAVLALLLYWAWLASLELFIFGLIALAGNLYFAFMLFIGLKERVICRQKNGLAHR